MAQALDGFQGTVFKVKRRFAEGGLAGVLKDRPQAHRYRQVDDRAEGHLIALACSPAPEGHDHGNLRLLADRMVELGVVESLSYETARLHLKNHHQAVAVVVLFTIFDRVTGEIFTVIDRDFHGL